MEQAVWGGFSTSAAQLAAHDAARIRSEHSALFRVFPVQPEVVARRLEIPVEFAQPTRGRAQLTVSSKPPRFSITVHPSLGPSTRRFAVAHELGHAILFGSHPEVAREFEVGSRERYADRFASHLLIPPSIRPYVSEVLRACEHPREVLTLASRFGVSPAAFLRISGNEGNGFRDSNTIWLRVKYTPNPATGVQPRLRVVSAHYDWTKFFIPRYVSLHSLCGDEWLSMLSPGGEAELSEVVIRLSTLNPERIPKYRREYMNVRLRGLRLSPSEHDKVPYFIVAISVNGDQLPQLPPLARFDEVLEQFAPVGEAMVEPDTTVPPIEEIQLSLW